MDKCLCVPVLGLPGHGLRVLHVAAGWATVAGLLWAVGDGLKVSWVDTSWGTLTGWPVLEGHGPVVSQKGAHQGCANGVAVNGRGVGRVNPCKQHTSATLVGLLDLLWACLCGGGGCEATSVMSGAGVCTLFSGTHYQHAGGM